MVEEEPEDGEAVGRQSEDLLGMLGHPADPLLTILLLLREHDVHGVLGHGADQPPPRRAASQARTIPPAHVVYKLVLLQGASSDKELFARIAGASLQCAAACVSSDC